MKYISFSLWGNRPMYVEGALANIAMYREMLPDWTCVFFVDRDVPPDFSERAKKIDPKVKIREMQFKAVGHLGSFWRHMVMGETIGAAMVRDADSRPTEREVWCVQQWIASPHRFHVIHDHPNHHGVMGGMWGCKDPWRNEFGRNFLSEMLQFIMGMPDSLPASIPITGNLAYFGANQYWLTCVSEFLFRRDIVYHNSKHIDIAVPRRSLTDFIGNKYQADGKPVYNLDPERQYKE